MKLTKLENDLLKSWAEETTFCSEIYNWQETVWAFAIRDAWKDDGHNIAQLSGVMSSLIKKGVIGFQDNSKEQNEEDRQDLVWFTDLGAEIMTRLFPERKFLG